MNDDRLVNILKEAVQLVPGTCIFVVDQQGVVLESALGDQRIAEQFNLRNGEPFLFVEWPSLSGRAGQLELDGFSFVYELWEDGSGALVGSVCALGGEKGTLEKLPHLVVLLAALLRRSHTVTQSGTDQRVASSARKLAHDVANYIATIDMAMQLILAQKLLEGSLETKARLVRDASQHIVSLVALFADEQGNRSET